MKYFASGCAAIALGLGTAVAATDPAASGVFPATRQPMGLPGTQGTTLTTDVYFPGTDAAVSLTAGRCPVIVLGHGFSQSKEQHINQGLHLATRGYVVLIPNSNAASDHSRYADDLRKCLDWIEARGVESIRRHEMELLAEMQEGLAAIEGVTIHGTRRLEQRVATMSFTVEGYDPSDVGTILDVDYGILTRTGLQCAPLIHEHHGTTPRGTVRASIGPFNTREHIRAMVGAVSEVAADRRAAVPVGR